ncbi:MAG: hypothetical protein O7G85_03010 [Planctomycetota bacterium]|nr:hypothetical protein [Planctomycetota bacterium]
MPDSDSLPKLGEDNLTNRTTWVYLLLVGFLTLYVGLLTNQRHERMDTDAWEHHRAVKVMTERLWPPEALGNPTYRADPPSIRYSPYSLALALGCRTTGLSPDVMMSVAGVFNTLLLGIGLVIFLGVFRCRSAATSVLLFMVLLYGRPTAYANSIALSDLPWHQVNPSAFAFGLTLLTWALYHQCLTRGRIVIASISCGLLAAIAILSHGMTGIFLVCGILALIIAAPRRTLGVELATFGAIVAIAFGLCCLWPWYDFLQAALSKPDAWFWYIDGVLKKIVFVWGLPTLALSIITIPMRKHPIIRFGHLCLLGTIVAAILAAILESALFMRLTFVGLTMVNLINGYAAAQTKLFDPRTWPGRLALIWKGERSPVVDVLMLLMIVYCSFFQLKTILREPHLARPFLAPLMGREDMQPMIWDTYQSVLSQVGSDDVVLADMRTMWPVPSFAGRIVAGLHLEFFITDEVERRTDVEIFSEARDLATIMTIVEKYDAQWILLDDRNRFWDTLHPLLPEEAEAARVRYLHLFDTELLRPASESSDDAENQESP